MSEETPHLVLADDDETVRNLVKMHAERGGFVVATGENGAEALALVKDDTDVVLLDPVSYTHLTLPTICSV